LIMNLPPEHRRGISRGSSTLIIVSIIPLKVLGVPNLTVP